MHTALREKALYSGIGKNIDEFFCMYHIYILIFSIYHSRYFVSLIAFLSKYTKNMPLFPHFSNWFKEHRANHLTGAINWFIINMYQWNIPV